MRPWTTSASRPADKAPAVHWACLQSTRDPALGVQSPLLTNPEVSCRICETQPYLAESAKCGPSRFRNFSGLLPMLADSPSWRSQEVMWGHNLAARRYRTSCRRCHGASCDCETRTEPIGSDGLIKGPQSGCQHRSQPLVDPRGVRSPLPGRDRELPSCPMWFRSSPSPT